MLRCYARLSGIVLFMVVAVLPGTCRGGIFGPDNFWECILDEMPGTATNAAANEIIRECGKKFPDRVPLATKKTGFWGIGDLSAEECTFKYGKETKSRRALNFIRRACRKIYPTENSEE